MSKTVLGIDLGSNSIGWAVLTANEKEEPTAIIDMGTRIFPKAVEDKTPTPKNVSRRNARLTRRVLQRRARRRQRMLNFLVLLKLLPEQLKQSDQPEIILNQLGDPYYLRARALDYQLTEFELGRVLLHLVQRRGFLSNKKVLLGQEMLDDPDVIEVLGLEQNEDDSLDDNEESEFKAEITQLRKAISDKNCRSLGEYLSKLDHHEPKRNRSGSFLRTDRQMYREEFSQIINAQKEFHPQLADDVIDQLEQIIFYQRPLKLNAGRVGKCSLETKNKRSLCAKLEFQRFRYLQDINNLKYFDHNSDKWIGLTQEDKQKLIALFEINESVTATQIKKALGLNNRFKLNLETSNKKFKGNTTATKIIKVYPQWVELSAEKKKALAEDIITIQKKSVLKKRLIDVWKMDTTTAVNMCLIELEPGHGSYSLKAINKLLPHLEQGHIFSDARVAAGYGYEVEKKSNQLITGVPETANPIVNKALHEVKKVVNAIIKKYGKPDVIRIEMARDLEMNTKRYKEFTSQQNKNTKLNDDAKDEYKKHAATNLAKGASTFASHVDKLKFRLWTDQHKICAYTGRSISINQLFSAEVEVDHILPFSQSLDDSYMNKVVCFAKANQNKGQRTPIDAFSGNADQWLQITRALESWDKKLRGKVNKFYMTDADVQKRDFLSSQLNDTRYISKLTLHWLKELGADVTTTKGTITSWLRHMWGLNSLLGETAEKERNDHRHHALDAVVISCVSRSFYLKLVKLSKQLEREKSTLQMRDLNIDEPFEGFRSDVDKMLQQTTTSHTAMKKITGALHEDTGVGFSEKHGGTVYRKNLDDTFSLKNADSILDDAVKNIVIAHLAKFANKPKLAFSSDNPVYHKDGKTQIKKVRVLQAKTTLKKLNENKLAITDSHENAFKWYAYGNTHHVDIYRLDNGKIKSTFMTMYEASKIVKEQGYRGLYDSDSDGYLFSLHRNDVVEIFVEENIQLMRVVKLDKISSKIELSKINHSGKEANILKAITTFIEAFKMRKIEFNILGKDAYHDKTHNRHL